VVWLNLFLELGGGGGWGGELVLEPLGARKQLFNCGGQAKSRNWHAEPGGIKYSQVQIGLEMNEERGGGWKRTGL